MAPPEDIQYIMDADGRTTAVVVPIEIWREIASERETAYLLRSETMKRRLLEARQREGGIHFDEVPEIWHEGQELVVDAPEVPQRRRYTMDEARIIAEEWQRRLAGQITSDSADLIREDRDR